MTEKPQQDVSRETQQDDPAFTPEQAMLNEIMDRSMSKYAEPQEDSDTQQGTMELEDVSRETHEEEKSSPLPEKNKPSSVYIYLAVLFGAAFLMLLLAYFVQQRNSSAVLDDLRMITATKEELMESIKVLEEEKSELQRNNRRLKYEADTAKEQYKKEKESAAENRQSLDEARSQLTSSVVLGYLERFMNEKDYLMAACIVQNCDGFFNERSAIGRTSTPYPTQVTRYMELRDWLEDHGHVVIQQYTSNDGSGTTEQPVVALDYSVNTSQETRDTVAAARNLWSVFWYYEGSPSNDPLDSVAFFVAAFCDPDVGNLESLNSKAFQPSTIALFEQIKADLMDRGMLTEVDGVIKQVKDGVPVDFAFGVFEESYCEAGAIDVLVSHPTLVDISKDPISD